jgi:hypothetical protein
MIFNPLRFPASYFVLNALRIGSYIVVAGACIIVAGAHIVVTGAYVVVAGIPRRRLHTLLLLVYLVVASTGP